MEYLQNASHKEEIMKNYARVTIYNKHLSITKIEQVAAYSLDGLFSDIGKKKSPYHGTKAHRLIIDHMYRKEDILIVLVVSISPSTYSFMCSSIADQFDP